MVKTGDRGEVDDAMDEVDDGGGDGCNHPMQTSFKSQGQQAFLALLQNASIYIYWSKTA